MKSTWVHSVIIGVILGVLTCVAVTITSCAHVATVADTCKPTASDVTLAAANLALDGYIAAMEQFAIGKVLCLVNAAVREAMVSTGAKTSLGATDEIVMRHGQTWLAMHPS